MVEGGWSRIIGEEKGEPETLDQVTSTKRGESRHSAKAFAMV